MGIDADTAALAHGADRLAELATELCAVAERLAGATVEARPGMLARRCAALVHGLRSDAARLAECGRLLGEDRTELLSADADAVAELAGVHRWCAGWPG